MGKCSYRAMAAPPSPHVVRCQAEPFFVIPSPSTDSGQAPRGISLSWFLPCSTKNSDPSPLAQDDKIGFNVIPRTTKRSEAKHLFLLERLLTHFASRAGGSRPLHPLNHQITQITEVSILTSIIMTTTDTPGEEGARLKFGVHAATDEEHAPRKRGTSGIRRRRPIEGILDVNKR